MSGPASTLARARARLRATPLHTAWRFAQSAVGAFRHRRTLADVKTLCLFVGHARSGHSIVGALLDAHPQIAISDELDALRYIDAGFSGPQVLYLSMLVSRRQADRARTKAGQGGSVYSYAVPGQWQGRHRELAVVGDSQAGWSVQRLARDRSLLGRTQKRIGDRELRFIHVTRNPFDNIAAMMLRGGRTFENAFDRYFTNCDAIVELADRIGDEHLLRIRHEDVVLDPRASLTRLCDFLGVEATPEYLEACAGILFPTPSRTREKIDWSESQRSLVESRSADFSFLSGYDFSS